MDHVDHKTIATANRVADTLHQRGHTEQADEVRAVLGRGGSLLLEALRDVCQLVLTAIEAIDPVSGTMVEDLRLEVDKRLKGGHGTSPPD